MGNTQCGRGLVCEANSDSCLPWCQPVDETMCGGFFTYCSGVNPTISWQGQEVGICVDI